MTREDRGSRKWLELMQESGTDHDGVITSLWGRWCCPHFTEETSELRSSETFPKSHRECGRPDSGSKSYLTPNGELFSYFSFASLF